MKYLFTFLLTLQLIGLEPLVVGTSSGYAPYVSVNGEGQFEGFDVDFAEELGKKLNRKVVLKDLGSMPSLLLGLEQKKVDLVIWAVSITDDRMKKMEMVYYQGEKVNEMPFLFWKEIPDGIREIEDLGKGKFKVSVEAGTFQENVIKKYPEVQTKQVEKITDAVMEIRYGKSSAAMVDPSLVSKLMDRHPEIKVLYLSLKPEDYAMGNGICIDKGNEKLIKEVKKATSELIAEKRVAELEKKWKMVR